MPRYLKQAGTTNVIVVSDDDDAALLALVAETYTNDEGQTFPKYGQVGVDDRDVTPAQAGATTPSTQVEEPDDVDSSYDGVIGQWSVINTSDVTTFVLPDPDAGDGAVVSVTNGNGEPLEILTETVILSGGGPNQSYWIGPYATAVFKASINNGDLAWVLLSDSTPANLGEITMGCLDSDTVFSGAVIQQVFYVNSPLGVSPNAAEMHGVVAKPAGTYEAGPVAQPSVEMSGLYNVTDAYDYTASLYVFSADGTSAIQVEANGSIDEGDSSVTIDWTSATVVSTVGEDLSFDEDATVQSAAGGTYAWVLTLNSGGD